MSKNAALNAGNSTLAVSAIAPNDVSAPTLTIDLQDDTAITAPLNITGTIAGSLLL
ncbi:MAG: hypothetical protein HC894_30235 [Microcoleus sp. SM1_3_4]|nr:hypothetical protein [Microcoleus sp. SM1_3_4]